jgi:hypothetical protein
MNINPIPHKLPSVIIKDPELFSYFNLLNKSLLQIWSCLTGNLNSTLISTTKNINAKAAGSTELLKVPATKLFIPLFIVIRVVNFVAGSKSTQVVASFGGNSSTFDDFLNSVTYTISSNNQFLIDKPDDASQLPIQSSDTSFRLIIETASNATTEEWEVDLFGYYV